MIGMGVWGETGAFVVRNDPHSGVILKNKPKGRRKYLGLGWLQPLHIFLRATAEWGGNRLGCTASDRLLQPPHARLAQPEPFTLG